MGLTGYVRNLPEGSVEVQAEGERKQLEGLIRHLKAGPTSSNVENTVTIWAEYTGDYNGFSIMY